MCLTPLQQEFINSVYPECRVEMTDYLKRGVEVFVRRQTECGDDVPPYSIGVVENPAFWIDCCETEQLAIERAKTLGLHVTTTPVES